MWAPHEDCQRWKNKDLGGSPGLRCLCARIKRLQSPLRVR